MNLNTSDTNFSTFCFTNDTFVAKIPPSSRDILAVNGLTYLHLEPTHCLTEMDIS